MFKILKWKIEMIKLDWWGYVLCTVYLCKELWTFFFHNFKVQVTDQTAMLLSCIVVISEIILLVCVEPVCSLHTVWCCTPQQDELALLKYLAKHNHRKNIKPKVKWTTRNVEWHICPPDSGSFCQKRGCKRRAIKKYRKLVIKRFIL